MDFCRRHIAWYLGTLMAAVRRVGQHMVVIDRPQLQRTARSGRLPLRSAGSRLVADPDEGIDDVPEVGDLAQSTIHPLSDTLPDNGRRSRAIPCSCVTDGRSGSMASIPPACSGFRRSMRV